MEIFPVSGSISMHWKYFHAIEIFPGPGNIFRTWTMNNTSQCGEWIIIPTSGKYCI